MNPYEFQISAAAVLPVTVNAVPAIAFACVLASLNDVALTTIAKKTGSATAAEPAVGIATPPFNIVDVPAFVNLIRSPVEKL